MAHRFVLVGLTRTAARNVTWNLVRALAAATVAGLGWKLGADAYEVAKRKLAARRDPEPPVDL